LVATPSSFSTVSLLSRPRADGVTTSRCAPAAADHRQVLAVVHLLQLPHGGGCRLLLEQRDVVAAGVVVALRDLRGVGRHLPELGGREHDRRHREAGVLREALLERLLHLRSRAQGSSGSGRCRC
jgi:hypothetical protein